MQIGLVISVLLHVAILGWAVFTIQTQRELRVAEPEPVAVDLVTLSELTKLRQGVRTAKQMDAEAKEAPKPEVARKEAPKPTPVTPKPEPPPEPKPEPKEEAKPEPPKPEPPKEVAKPEPPKPEPPKEEAKPEPAKEIAKAEPPKPVEPPKPAEPAKDPIAEKLATDQPDPALEQAKLEEKIREEQKKAEEQKKLEEEKKLAELKKKKEDEAKKRKEAEIKRKRDEEKRLKEAEAKKNQKSFDDHMREQQALLNKIPDKGAPLSNTAPEEPTKNKGPVLGAREGRDKQLSASEIAILAQIIKSCVQSKWNVLGGGESAKGAVVKIRLRFSPDGRFTSAPEVMNPQNSPFFLAVQDSALRAVEACQPYPLPPAKYEFWKDMVLNFDPRDMF